MAVHRDGENALGRILADDVLVELRQDFTRRGDPREELFTRAASFSFLVEDRLAKLDALAADVNVAGPFDKGTDVSITLATERAERVLFCRTTAACAANVPTGGHEKLLLDSVVFRADPAGDAQFAPMHGGEFESSRGCT